MNVNSQTKVCLHITPRHLGGLSSIAHLKVDRQDSSGGYRSKGVGESAPPHNLQWWGWGNRTLESTKLRGYPQFIENLWRPSLPERRIQQAIRMGKRQIWMHKRGNCQGRTHSSPGQNCKGLGFWQLHQCPHRQRKWRAAASNCGIGINQKYSGTPWLPQLCRLWLVQTVSQAAPTFFNSYFNLYCIFSITI